MTNRAPFGYRQLAEAGPGQGASLDAVL